MFNIVNRIQESSWARRWGELRRTGPESRVDTLTMFLLDRNDTHFSQVDTWQIVMCLNDEKGLWWKLDILIVFFSTMLYQLHKCYWTWMTRSLLGRNLTISWQLFVLQIFEWKYILNTIPPLPQRLQIIQREFCPDRIILTFCLSSALYVWAVKGGA